MANLRAQRNITRTPPNWPKGNKIMSSIKIFIRWKYRHFNQACFHLWQCRELHLLFLALVSFAIWISAYHKPHYFSSGFFYVYLRKIHGYLRKTHGYFHRKIAISIKCTRIRPWILSLCHIMLTPESTLQYSDVYIY